MKKFINATLIACIVVSFMAFVANLANGNYGGIILNLFTIFFCAVSLSFRNE